MRIVSSVSVSTYCSLLEVHCISIVAVEVVVVVIVVTVPNSKQGKQLYRIASGVTSTVSTDHSCIVLKVTVLCCK